LALRAEAPASTEAFGIGNVGAEDRNGGDRCNGEGDQ
jgi:hypothetical protein